MTIGLTAVVAVTVALPLLPAFTPRAALACGVVGTGTPGSCTEAALDAALGCGAPSGSPPVSNCTGSGTVTFNCGGAATFILTSGKTISTDTTIDGGSLITISGEKSIGIFDVNASVSFTLQNLTITKASARTGAIYNGRGSLTITNCTFTGNAPGGSISNAGTATITNSTFSGNSRYGWAGDYNNDGAAIANGDFAGGETLTITNSTFSGNYATYGGAIRNLNATVTITNSTFSGNSAAYASDILNDSGTVTVTNTIIASSGDSCEGSVTDGGHNIDDGTSCGFTGTGCANTTGSSFCNTNPVLDPTGLQNNGGPTQTIALQAGSPAINAGNESVCAASPVNNLDQRGFGRPGTGVTNCSIGAFEFNSPAIPTLSNWGIIGFSSLAFAFVLWAGGRSRWRSPWNADC